MTILNERWEMDIPMEMGEMAIISVMSKWLY